MKPPHKSDGECRMTLIGDGYFFVEVATRTTADLILQRPIRSAWHLRCPAVFYTGWKHTPPQHPLLACSRSDTLYVIAVRHPKAWQASLKRKSYDFRYDPRLKLWRLRRSDPRRLPPLEVRFRSLYNAWEFYMTGYLAWEEFSAGRNCYSAAGGGGEGGARNCLWGDNEISRDRRNVVIVRYEGATAGQCVCCNRFRYLRLSWIFTTTFHLALHYDTKQTI